MNKFNKEHLLGIICIVIAIVVIIMASTFPPGNKEKNIPGPGFFPIILSVMMIICGVYSIIHGFVKKDIEPIDFKLVIGTLKSKNVIKLTLIMGFFLAFILLHEVIGFIICMVGFLIGTMKQLSVGWRSTIIATVVLTGLVIFLFSFVFHVSLPSGILQYIGL